MNLSQRKVSGAPLPTRKEAFIFALKARGLRSKRSLADLFSPVFRHRSRVLPNTVLLSESVSPLWTGEDTSKALIIGKIHNIRSAAKYLNGVVIPMGHIFSFWKQVGKLTTNRGYTLGRELREGCVIPSTGGGICQLTNAIYDAALKAGLEVVERHRHSQVIAGSLAEFDRDATVFWNYLDLRLRFYQTWQLEVKMDKDFLTVRIFGESRGKTANSAEINKKCESAALGDCTTCGRTDCYLNTPNLPSHDRKTYLATEEEWTEFTAFRKAEFKDGDRLISTTENPPFDTKLVNLFSKAIRRFYIWRGNPLPPSHNSRFKLIAKHFAKKLNADDTHLVVPQNLLIWLYLLGELAGREYDVLMNALPITMIEQRLDEAMKHYGLEVLADGKIRKNSKLYGDIDTTLGDFRAPKELAEAENEALRGASRLICSHSEILKYASTRSVALPWSSPALPKSTEDKDKRFKVLLAGSALARKGVYDLRLALKKLDFPFALILPPSTVKHKKLWSGIDVVYASSLREGARLCDVAVLPAWVEHSPRGLLSAHALGKPIIATKECGLTDDIAYTSVKAGDFEDLVAKIKAVFAQSEKQKG